MSIYTEIIDHEVKSYITELCDTRWRKMSAPCKGCRYRTPIDDGVSCCMFLTLPRDWPLFEKESG